MRVQRSLTYRASVEALQVLSDSRGVVRLTGPCTYIAEVVDPDWIGTKSAFAVGPGLPNLIPVRPRAALRLRLMGSNPRKPRALWGIMPMT